MFVFASRLFGNNCVKNMYQDEKNYNYNNNMKSGVHMMTY